MLRRLLLSLSLVLSLASGAFAAPPAADKAHALIEGMASEAISTLSAQNRTEAQISDKFHSILQKNFDLPAIGRFTLGRYWRTATPQQQAEYLKLFEDYIVGVYANRFKAYSGETVHMGESKIDGDNVIVASKINLTRGQQPVNVDWKVTADSTNAPRVTDVIIEQVSMSLTQRSEFASIIQNNGGQVEALLAQLRSRVGTPAAVVTKVTPAAPVVKK